MHLLQLTTHDYTGVRILNVLSKDTGEETVDGRQGGDGLCLFNGELLHQTILVIGDVPEITRVTVYEKIW